MMMNFENFHLIGINFRYKSPEWEIHADLKVAESAAISKRLNGSLIGIFQDLDLLSDCEFIICTLSSQVS